jgi:tripartite ATP-independent transporter DctM subunit
MSNIIIGIFSVIVFLILMFGGINIPFSMLFGGALGILLMRGPAVASQMVAAELFNTFSNYMLTVGPMFGLMGFLASYTGIGGKLFRCLNAFLGHKRAGMASAVQVASAGFGAICGTPPACCATMTTVAYPEMRKYGYAPEIAALSIVAGGTLSVLIPPSNTYIIYGIATETSISHLFVAGIIPGILLTLINIVTIQILAKRHPEWVSKGKKYTWKERWQSILNGGILETAAVFVISMGGMFAGFFTPTEAGAIGVFGMALVSLVSRQFSIKRFINALYSAARMQAMIYMLLGCANVLAKMFSVSQIPTHLGKWVTSLDVSNLAIILVITAIYFILGCFTDLAAMVLVTIPMFYPIVVDYCGYSSLWFGTFIILLMSVGSITPPVGTALFMQKGFISKYDPDVSVGRLFAVGWPWVFNRFVAIVLLLMFPNIVTWLPNILYSK